MQFTTKHRSDALIFQAKLARPGRISSWPVFITYSIQMLIDYFSKAGILRVARYPAATLH